MGNFPFGFPHGPVVENQPANGGHMDLILEEEMATHSSALTWTIPWMEESGKLYSPWGHKESWA